MWTQLGMFSDEFQKASPVCEFFTFGPLHIGCDYEYSVAFVIDNRLDGGCRDPVLFSDCFDRHTTKPLVTKNVPVRFASDILIYTIVNAGVPQFLRNLMDHLLAFPPLPVPYFTRLLGIF